MRAAAIAAAVFAAFVGVMYLRFSGDAVPAPEPKASPIVGADGSVCIIARRADAPDPTPTPAGGPDRAPCATFTPDEFYSLLNAATPAPAAQPVIPEFLKGMKVITLEVGPPLDLPKDLAFVIETGCWQCDGGPGSLVRIYSRADGSVARDPLLDSSALGLPPRQFTDANGTVTEYPPSITGWAMASDASNIVASVCLRGTCAPDGLSSWSPDSQTALFRSTNGGVSWTELARLEVGAAVFALLPDESTILSTYDTRESTVVRRYPTLEELPLPPAAQYGGVMVLPDGQLISRDGNGIPTRSDGQPLIAVPAGSSTYVEEVLFEPKQLDGLASISVHSGGRGIDYLVPFDHTGTIGRGAFAWAGDSVIWSTDMVRLGVYPPDDGLMFGNAYVPSAEPSAPGQGPLFDYRPAVVDLQKGTMHVLRPFVDPEPGLGRSHIVAVQQGPFARVVNTEGTCLYVRMGPTTGAPSVDCAAEGVLLRDYGETTVAEGTTWLRVQNPAGTDGWASTQYLER